MKRILRISAVAATFALPLTPAGLALAQGTVNPPTPSHPPPTARANPTTPPEIVAPRAGARGVVRPPNVDPGMAIHPPAGKFPTPIIVPPSGTRPELGPK